MGALGFDTRRINYSETLVMKLWCDVISRGETWLIVVDCSQESGKRVGLGLISGSGAGARWRISGPAVAQVDVAQHVALAQIQLETPLVGECKERLAVLSQ